MPGSGRLWLAALVAGILIALALVATRERSPRREDPGTEVARAALAPSPSPAASPSARTARALSRGSARTTAVALPDGTLPPQIQRFLEENKYPPTSRPLTADAIDLLEPNRRYEKPRPLGEDREITFVFTTDRYYYTGDETALVWLEVRRGDQPAAVTIDHAVAIAEERGAPAGPAVDLGLRPDGILWSSALDLGRTFPEHHGTILLEVAFRAEEGELHSEAIRIFSTPPDRIPARFTGEFRDSIVDGSLLVEVGVDVTEPGFYRFDANLFDRDGEPVAFSVFKGDLGPGEQWVPLEFFGKILRDQGAVGPYTIEQIRGYRFLEAQTPDREPLPDEPLVHTTAPYAPEAFSDEEYTSEHKERMIQLMLEDLDEGRTLDLPPMPRRPGTG